MNAKTFALLFLCLAGFALLAQEAETYLTPDVARVGDRLACRCGGCRNTVGNCPMIKCGSADPKRHRIAQMKNAGLSDDAIVNTFVREEGVVALSSPPAGSIGGLVTWVMPGLVLLLGFVVYLRYLRGHRAVAVEMTEHDRAAMERFRTQIDRDLEDEEQKTR